MGRKVHANHARDHRAGAADPIAAAAVDIDIPVLIDQLGAVPDITIASGATWVKVEFGGDGSGHATTGLISTADNITFDFDSANNFEWWLIGASVTMTPTGTPSAGRVEIAILDTDDLPYRRSTVPVPAGITYDVCVQTNSMFRRGELGVGFAVGVRQDTGVSWKIETSYNGDSDQSTVYAAMLSAA